MKKVTTLMLLSGVLLNQADGVQIVQNKLIERRKNFQQSLAEKEDAAKSGNLSSGGKSDTSNGKKDDDKSKGITQ